MKKIKFILFAAAALIVASCARESDDSVSVGRRTVTFFTEMPSVKTALGGKDAETSTWPNYWKTGDMISVNGVTSDALAEEYDGKTYAEFTVEAGEAPYCAAYPASAVSGYDSQSAEVQIPADQSYVEGSYDPAAYVMVGSTAETNLQLAPVVSILHFTVSSADAAIQKIRVEAPDGISISGIYATDFTGLGETLMAADYVEVTNPSPVAAASSDFFAVVRAGISASMKVTVLGADGGRTEKTINLKNPLEAGRMYKVPVIAYEPDYTINAVVSDITSSTAVICWDNAPAPSYRIAVCSDNACTAEVASYTVPAGDPCWQGMTPAFCVSGLKAATQYWVRVTNVDKGISSEPAEFTTEDFTPVTVTPEACSEGDIILAEDFSELCWDCDMIGAGAGWFPTEAARTTSFTTLDIDSYQAAATSNEKVLSFQQNALAVSRLKDWAQGANRNLYIHPGYIKLVGSSKVTHIVTPALVNIPEGKIATLEVTVSASAYYSESSGAFCTDKAVVAVQTGDIQSMIGDNTNTLDLKSNVADIKLKQASEWNNYTVTLNGVENGNRLAFGAASDVTKNDARMNLNGISVKIVKLYDAGTLTAELKKSSSSTASFRWTHAGVAEYDVSKPYNLALYEDEACTKLVVSYDIPAGSECWGGKIPCFVFAGLESSTNYYFCVRDVDNMDDPIVSNVVPVRTADFTNVGYDEFEGIGKVGDVILAENFSEWGYGVDEVAGAAGVMDNNKTLTRYEGPVDMSTVALKPSSDNGTRFFNYTVIWDTDSRIEHWGFAGNSSTYIKAGYIRATTTDSKNRTHIVSPKLLGIPDGKVATIEVTARMLRTEADNDFGVLVQTGSMSAYSSTSNPRTCYKLGTLASDNKYPFGMTTVDGWETHTVTIKNMTNGNSLAFGSIENVDTKNRFFVTDISVKIVDLVDPTGEYDITDGSSLIDFMSAVDGGVVSATANLKADVTLTPQEAEALVSPELYGGTFNGNGHSIGGLVLPLFGKIGDGAVISDLTLNSTITETGEVSNVGALARTIGKASVSQCVTNGSITLSELASSSLYAGGMAGTAGASFSGCTSNVAVTVNDGTISGSLYLGGIAGWCDGVLSSVTNNGAVKSDGIAVGGALWQGGVAGKMSPADDSDIAGITNNGAVTIGAASCTQGYWGGVFGDNSSTTNRNLTNAGALSIGAIVPSSYFFIGGIAGNVTSYGAVYENAVCTSAASITVDGTSISTSTGFALGGLFGKMTNFQTVKGSNNSAPIAINSMVKVVNGRYDIGGIVGYIQITGSNDHENGVVSFADVFNAGSISFTGSEPTRSATYIRVGGLVGNALSERSAGDETLSVKDCSNSGAITLPMNASQKVGIVVGGLIGHDRFAHYVQSGSYNAGNIVLSGVNYNEKDNGMYGLHIGGNVGFICHESSAATATITGDSVNPTNSGSVSYEVTATYCAYRPAVGGIVGVAAGKGETKPLKLDITDCSNAGSLQMKMNSMPTKTNMGYVYSYSYAGGILGIAGIPYSDPDSKEDEAYDDYSYVISNISNCSNSATVKWGKINSSISSSYNYYWSTYAGGILGTTRCVPGTEYKTTITSCTNTGDILSYDGCAGGIAGAIPYSGTITGTADAYTTNTGKVMKGGASKPQGQAGGIVGWTSVDDTCPDALEYSYCCNTGYVYGNNGAGGFMGRVTNFKGYTGLIHHLKLAGTVQSSTSTGNVGSFSPNDSGNIKANSDKISNIAIGGTVNGKNSAATTTTYNATDFVTQVRANFMEYKTSANNLSEDQVTSMKLQYWDGVSEPEWK